MKISWILFGVLILGAIIVVKLSSTPAVGTISKKKAAETVPTAVETIREDGKLISFSYINKYDLRQDGPDEDRFHLVGKAGVFNEWNISVLSSNQSSLDDVSAVQMRRMKTDMYTEEPIIIDGKNGLLFKTKAGSEWVSLLMANGKLITIAMTTTSTDSNGETEYVNLVKSVKLKTVN